MDTTTSPLKLQFPELPSQNISEKHISVMLLAMTGYLYTFASSCDMRWGADGEVQHIENSDFTGPYYQLMPEITDDGFFDWYCDLRPDQQFFETKEDCTLHFINYWHQWKHEKEKVADYEASIDTQNPKEHEHLLFKKTSYTTSEGETLLHCPRCEFDYVHLLEAYQTSTEHRPAAFLKFECENGHTFSVHLHNHKGYMLSDLEIENIEPQ